jgi:hypothetical protein
MLAILTCHFNPASYLEPRRNLLRFLRQTRSLGLPTFTAELAYDDRPFLLPQSAGALQLRCSSDHILWHKENLLNLLAERVPAEFDKLAWIDPDLWFDDLTWPQKAEQMLASCAVIQLFDQALWLNRDGAISDVKRSFALDRAFGDNHPGFAWAARRDLWSQGGLCERSIVGGGDTELTRALTSPAATGWSAKIHAWAAAHGGFGYLPGAVLHEWHGEYRRRGYEDRHALLAGRDLGQLIHRRPDGLLEYTEAAPADFREAIRGYFISRQEDAGTTWG